MEERVILVDTHDQQTGTMEKLEAHRKGQLHRAISVFIFNSRNELLLQKRAASKYHSAGLWTNTCCSHPRPGEATAEAASRRLLEEMGMQANLQFKTAFVYRSEFENGLTEYEYDHVFTGISDEQPEPDKDEADDYCWKAVNDVKKHIAEHPEIYTTWFRIAMKEIF